MTPPPFARWPRLPLLLVAMAALGAIWPLVWYGAEFRTLFLFQDEWDQLRQLDQEGLGRWAFSTFGENFMPLSKLAWYLVLAASGGSYFAVIVALWLNHAANCFLLGHLLVRRGVGVAGALVAVALLGYSATTYETLGWSIQWSNVVTLTFFLLALHLVERVTEAAAPPGWVYGLLFALLAASALSFVRGIFCGLAIGGLMVLPLTRTLDWRRRALVLALGVVPAVTVFAFMQLHSVGTVRASHQFTSEVLGRMANFAVHCYARDPLANWWTREVPTNGAILMLAVIRTAIFAGGWWLAPGRLRPVLVALVLFELANDAALGAGRFHTGLNGAGSSRYQYNSLLVFAPFVAVLFDRLIGGLSPSAGSRALVTAVVLSLAARGMARSWPWVMTFWPAQRGGELRAALALPPEQTPPNLSGVPGIDNGELRALVARHRLH